MVHLPDSHFRSSYIGLVTDAGSRWFVEGVDPPRGEPGEPNAATPARGVADSLEEAVAALVEAVRGRG
jgi:hypothetical protein